MAGGIPGDGERSEKPKLECSVVRVAIIDGEQRSREIAVGVVETQPDLTIVATGSTGAEALQVAKDLRPEVVMLGLSLPDAAGEHATQSIVDVGVRPPAVLAMTGGVDADLAIAAIRAGAAGVCTTDDPPEVVLQSVRSIAAGGAAVSPSLLGQILRRIVPRRPAQLDACSNREVEVLGLVANGATNPEIGERLFISPTTVRSHVQSLRHKLGARSRIDLVVFGHRSGLAEPHPNTD
jgi:DNA-binding NarL/FixJ family response regulator